MSTLSALPERWVVPVRFFVADDVSVNSTLRVWGVTFLFLLGHAMAVDGMLSLWFRRCDLTQGKAKQKNALS